MKMKRIVEFYDGTFEVQECSVGSNWTAAHFERFKSEHDAIDFVNSKKEKMPLRVNDPK